MSEGETTKKQAPEIKSGSADDHCAVKENARAQLSLDAGLGGKGKGGSDDQKTGSDALKPDEKVREVTPFHDLLKEMYGPRALAAAQKRKPSDHDLMCEPIPGYDVKPVNASLDRRNPQAGATELAHSDHSSIVRDKNGAITDAGDINGQHYDITASKDKDSIVWKDKDGKEHRFERKKGENLNEYADGDGTKLVQHGDKNTITFKNGYEVDIDARTGRTIITRGEQELAQYNGKDAVKRQIDDNNVAYQVRGDVGATVEQIRDSQKRSGQSQHGNILIKNEKGDTVVLQQDGTEISRKADSSTVTIKQGDTTVVYTPGQKPVITGGAQRVTETNGGIQIDGKDVVNADGTVAISGMQNGRLDSRYGRIYGTTDRGGAIDLGTGRAIADDLTTQNTGTGVKATAGDGTVVMETGADGKKIQSGPVTTNVDADHPTTTISGGDGVNMTINNEDGSSKMTDAAGNEIACIDGAGNVDTWDGTHLGADGDIWNADMGLSGFTGYDPSEPGTFLTSDLIKKTEHTTNSVTVAKSCEQQVSLANSTYANASALANNLDASPGTLGLIDSNIGALASLRSEAQALVAINPKLADQLGAIDAAWSQLDGLRPVIQNQVAAAELLRTNYGVVFKDGVARTAALGSSPQAADQVADYYQLQQTA